MASQISGSRLFTRPFIQAQIKENIKAPRHWPFAGNSPVTGEFPSQRASNAENLSIWWRHHASYICGHRLIILRLARNYQYYLSLIEEVEGCRYGSLRSFKRQYVSRRSQYKDRLFQVWGFPWDRLILNMGIPILVRRYLCIEKGLWMAFYFSVIMMYVRACDYKAVVKSYIAFLCTSQDMCLIPGYTD